MNIGKNFHHRAGRLRYLSALTGIVLCIGVAPIYAVDDDGYFELGDGSATVGSGDILGSGAQPGPDWADLFNADGEVVNLFGGVAATFAADDLAAKGATDDTTFASSNKNEDLISTWNWDTGNTPGKDDIGNAYAYAVFDSNSKLRLYAGLERLRSNGDAHVDMEFNQQSIALDKEPPCNDDGTDGPADGSPCEFTGVKEVNDLLVAMDFEIGGDLGILRVFRWDGSEYVEVLSLGSEGCNAAVGSIPADTICAFNNGSTINGGPWPNYDSQGNEVTSLEPNAFTEFGLIVSDALSGASVCFASVNIKTRTSQSINSELKDFSLHPFEECNATVTTEVYTNPGDVKVADDAEPIPYTSQIPVFTVVDDTATVTGITGLAPTGSVSFYLYANSDCTGTPIGNPFDTQVLPAGSDTSKSVTSTTYQLTTAGSYGFSATYSGDGNYPSAESGCEAWTVTTIDSSVNTEVVTGSGPTETDVTNTALDLGTVVRDKAIVLGSGTTDPTGDVVFRRYATAACSGSYTDETQTLADDASDDGMATAYSDPLTLSTEAFHCWQVFYQGDDVYSPSSSSIGEPICTFDFDPDLSTE